MAVCDIKVGDLLEFLDEPFRFIWCAAPEHVADSVTVHSHICVGFTLGDFLNHLSNGLLVVSEGQKDRL